VTRNGNEEAEGVWCRAAEDPGSCGAHKRFKSELRARATSPIRRMGTWLGMARGESSRPELLSAGGLQRAADHRPHEDIIGT